MDKWPSGLFVLNDDNLGIIKSLLDLTKTPDENLRIQSINGARLQKCHGFEIP